MFDITAVLILPCSLYVATSNLTLRSLTPTCLCYATSLCVAMLHDFPYAVTVGLLGVRVFFSAVMYTSYFVTCSFVHCFTICLCLCGFVSCYCFYKPSTADENVPVRLNLEHLHYGPKCSY